MTHIKQLQCVNLYIPAFATNKFIASDPSFIRMAVIVRDEKGEECQRLLHFRGKNKYVDSLPVVGYSIEYDVLTIHHLDVGEFLVIPKNKNKTYLGDIQFSNYLAQWTKLIASSGHLVKRVEVGRMWK